eukprot:Hpha_TRINITY_DN28255_c0_g1::TRINITY_DN28255_c0_g1_i1::g.116782::m.116782
MGCCFGTALGSDQLNEGLLSVRTPLQFVNEADRGPVGPTTADRDTKHLHRIICQAGGNAQCLEQNEAGYTCLHLATEKNRIDLVKVLVNEAGAYKPHEGLTEVKKKGGSTALHIAAVRGYEDVCYALLDGGANPLAKNDGDSTAREHTVTDFDLSRDESGVLRERKERKDRMAKRLIEAEKQWANK